MKDNNFVDWEFEQVNIIHICDLAFLSRYIYMLLLRGLSHFSEFFMNKFYRCYDN
jgi:hypothetical protein